MATLVLLLCFVAEAYEYDVICGIVAVIFVCGKRHSATL